MLTAVFLSGRSIVDNENGSLFEKYGANEAHADARAICRSSPAAPVGRSTSYATKIQAHLSDCTSTKAHGIFWTRFDCVRDAGFLWSCLPT